MSYVFTPSWIEFVSKILWKTLHLLKDKNILRTLRKISLILLWLTNSPYKVSYLYMKWALFSFEFSPELPCLEVTYKKALRSLESLIFELRQRDSFAAAKICKNWPYNIFDEWVKSCFSKFLSVMSDVSLIR